MKASVSGFIRRIMLACLFVAFLGFVVVVTAVTTTAIKVAASNSRSETEFDFTISTFDAATNNAATHSLIARKQPDAGGRYPPTVMVEPTITFN